LTENGTKETNLRYSNGLVVERVICKMTPAVTTLKYDKQNNIIEENQRIVKDYLILLLKLMINTIILLQSKNFANKIKHSIYNEYDYKNKFLISKNSMDTKLQKEVVIKRYLIKNGYIKKVIT
jgi:hypothetical protein